MSIAIQQWPPRIEEVKIYFSQKGMAEQEAEHFFLFYELKGWKNNRGIFYRSWKDIAYKWIAQVLKLQPWLFNKEVH